MHHRPRSSATCSFTSMIGGEAPHDCGMRPLFDVLPLPGVPAAPRDGPATCTSAGKCINGFAFRRVEITIDAALTLDRSRKRVHIQVCRTQCIALQMLSLCDISSRRNVYIHQSANTHSFNTQVAPKTHHHYPSRGPGEMHRGASLEGGSGAIDR